MIKIDKPGPGPDALERPDGKGKLATAKMSAEYDSFPQDYQLGAKQFEFDNEIYGHKSVKQALIKTQHGKCCYCEAYVRHVAHGDIEHFRPKAAVRQRNDAKDARPGYYWLAYEWSNFFSPAKSATSCTKKRCSLFGVHPDEPVHIMTQLHKKNRC